MHFGSVRFVAREESRSAANVRYAEQEGHQMCNQGEMLAAVTLISALFHAVKPAYTQAKPAGGEVLAWHSQAAGRSGEDRDSGGRLPMRIPGLHDVVAIASARDGDLLVEADGTVWAWTESRKQERIIGLRSVTAVASGSDHKIALRIDGTVWSWGENLAGQLGRGIEAAGAIPRQVSGLGNVIGVAAGAYHSLAVRSDGTVWSWGGNRHGELGNGSNVDSNLPVAVSRIAGMVAVSGGATHSLALGSDGTVWTWGDNSYGQLGDGSYAASNVPVQVLGMTGVIAIAAGEHHSLALNSGGTVWEWGKCRNGEFGDATRSNSNLPKRVVGLEGVVNVAEGSSHSLALKADGTVWEWGENGGPAQVANLSGVRVIAAAGHNLAIATSRASAGGIPEALAEPAAQPVSAPVYTYNINTVAGSGTNTFSGDNGSATSAGMAPGGVARDASGSLFITDNAGGHVRKINPAGVITTLVNNGCQTPVFVYCLNHVGQITTDKNGNAYFTYSDGSPNAVLKLDTLGNVTVFAGGNGGYSGDGGPAKSAQVSTGEGGMTFDGSGNFYLADADNHRIRKVSPSGIITTVAGNGVSGYSGDGGPATAAQLNRPLGVAADGVGNLYIADANNHRVRKVDTSGTITTVAGNGVNGYSSDGGPALTAQLSFPNSVSADTTGRLFIIDSGNNAIRLVDTSGFITTIAGTGSSGFGGDGGPATSATAKLYVPTSLVFGSGNSIYFADTGNYRIRQLTVSCTHSLSGAVNIGNSVNNVGQSFNDAGGSGAASVTASPGNCAWTAVSDVPWITITSGNSGSGNGAVTFSVDPNRGPARTGTLRIGGVTFTVLQDAAACTFSVTPAGGNYGVAAANGKLTVNASAGCDWTVLNNNPEFLTITAGATGSGSGPIGYTVALNTSPTSRIGTLSIVDSNGLRAATFSITQAGLTSALKYTIGTVAGGGSNVSSGDYGQATLAGMAPDHLARDASGNLYFTDRASGAGGARVRKVSTSGIITTIAGGGPPYAPATNLAINSSLYNPGGIAVDRAGNVYFTHDNAGGPLVYKVDASGLITVVVGNGNGGFTGDGGPATSAELASGLRGLTIDSAGNLYIADTGNNRVRKVNTSGIITTVAGNGTQGFSGDGGPATLAQLKSPNALVVDAAGNLYIADTGNFRIRKVDLSGTITTVAGNGSGQFGGFSGDGGPATSAQLSAPSGVAVDGAGRIFIGDTANMVIRLVDTSGIITTVAGNRSPGYAGDGGAATSAKLDNPASMVVGPDGTVYFVDSANVRVRKLTPAVAASAPATGILLTQSGFTFQSVQGGGSPAPESFQILNASANTVTYTLTPSTASGGSNWLTVSPLGGSIAPGQAATITVSVDPTQISPAAPRDYYGQIQVDAQGVANTPQMLSVVLNLLPSNSTQPPLVEPTGLVFLGSAGGGNPAAQSVRITNLGNRTSSFTSVVTLSGTSVAQTVFTASPVSGTVAPNQPATVSVNADLSGLPFGVYRGTLALQFQPDTITQLVALVLVIAPGKSGAVPDSPGPRAACTPTRLVPTLTLLGANFSTVAGWPTNIQAVVVDDCANYIDTGSVTATFSNNDQQLALQDSGAHIGQWSVTWAAQHALSAGLTVTVSAQANGLSGTTSVTGGALANPNVPLVYTNGTVSAGSYSPSATPSAGELVSVFGAQLADGTQSAGALPLSNSLQNAAVTLGGVKLPLVFTSTGQINAQIPYKFPGDVTLPLVVQHGDRVSLPQAVRLAVAEPAIFTTNLLGTGQGYIFVVPGPGQQLLADPSAPAKAGDVLLIYCTGLGQVDPPVNAGEAVSSDVLHRVTNPVTLTIGGVPVTPDFAGLTPGFTGLYQINATKMPSGVTPGDQVPVTITVGGVYQSQPVTMAVK
jgi:uncharacterized protein (TIGR03437 family)